MNGSLMVPFTYFLDQYEGDDSGLVELSYLFSFAVGILLANSLFLLALAAFTPDFKLNFKVALGPGLITGILWRLFSFFLFFFSFLSFSFLSFFLN